jgi:hypothetical protein
MGKVKWPRPGYIRVAMSPESVRLLFVSGLSILLGGFFGAYATKSIYDTPSSQPRRDVPREKLACPPCAACPACPVADACDHGLIPTSTVTRTVLVSDDEPEHDRKTGLPMSAIKLASERVRAMIDPCLRESAKANAQGALLLELTVTATGSQGFISEATIGKRSPNTSWSEEIERCLVDGARQARFEWDDGDGEAHFRLPVKLGPGR